MKLSYCWIKLFQRTSKTWGNHYKVKLNNPGKYFVWIRAFSIGTKDNGLQVGLNEKWMESGQYMQ